MPQLSVVSFFDPQSVVESEKCADTLTEEDCQADAVDSFNHPRKRRALILDRLRQEASVSFLTPTQNVEVSEAFSTVHSEGLLDFLKTAWNQWIEMGEEGRDVDHIPIVTPGTIPALIFGNAPLPRDPYQEPSSNVVGQIGYYCTDDCTPIFAQLWSELQSDTNVVATAIDTALEGHTAVYALPTHPGHHAARDSFGGYCYLNQAAHAVRRFQKNLGETTPVAVIDVGKLKPCDARQYLSRSFLTLCPTDYHCGNGTASIFYSDPTVLVVSIHCDPNFEYPFHSGFVHQNGAESGLGKTIHIPLPPKTNWEQYSLALRSAVEDVVSFNAKALIVSLGLDTLDKDPCAFRRAGFCLSGDDYQEMGKVLAGVGDEIPVVFIQEGGYLMGSIPEAATKVVTSFSEERARS